MAINRFLVALPHRTSQITVSHFCIANFFNSVPFGHQRKWLPQNKGKKREKESRQHARESLIEESGATTHFERPADHSIRQHIGNAADEANEQLQPDSTPQDKPMTEPTRLAPVKTAARMTQTGKYFMESLPVTASITFNASLTDVEI